MLTLICPKARTFKQYGQDPWQDLRLPGLADLLARGQLDSSPGVSDEQTLLDVFQVPHASCAALSAAVDLPGQAAGAYWMRVDPVHLRADRDGARLFMGEQLVISADEAAAWIAGLNDLYAPDGWRFWAPSPSRWYVSLPARPEIRCVSPSLAHGQDIRELLPKGPQALHWHKVLNEWQMYLYAHPLNDVREAAGQLSVNSLWLWGEGEVVGKPSSPAAQVYGDSILLQGLAQAAGVRQAPMPRGLLDLAGQAGASLVYLNHLSAPLQLGDWDGWQAQLLVLEQAWFAPLLQAWRRGQIRDARVIFSDPEQALTLTLAAKDRWKFWRRSRSGLHALSLA